MAELKSDRESTLRELVMEDLDEEKRRLFETVHGVPQGCELMGYLDEHPNEMSTIDDLAFHVQERAYVLSPTVDALFRLGLLRRLEASGTLFYGLVEDAERRAEVHELFNWQRGWHHRLMQIENLVDGRPGK